MKTFSEGNRIRLIRHDDAGPASATGFTIDQKWAIGDTATVVLPGPESVVATDEKYAKWVLIRRDRDGYLNDYPEYCFELIENKHETVHLNRYQILKNQAKNVVKAHG